MKKTALALTTCLALYISSTGCSAALSSSDSLDTDNNSISTSGSSTMLTDKVDPPFTAASFAENEATGIPQSYEELQDFIRPYSSVNYLGFEIIKRYSAEEAFEVTNDDMFLYGATLYDIHVTYDYINAQQLDIYTKLSSAGTVEEQLEGYPPYLEGDKFACFLPQFDPNAVNYEFPELMFAIDDEVQTPIGYHIGFDVIDFVNQDGTCIAEDSFAATSVITSTSNNPVTYTDMISMDTLSDFLRDDWTERGYELTNNFLTT